MVMLRQMDSTSVSLRWRRQTQKTLSEASARWLDGVWTRVNTELSSNKNMVKMLNIDLYCWRHKQVLTIVVVLY